MADLRFSITKLNNTNYEIWKSKVELLLIKEDLWHTVITDNPTDLNEKWIKADGQARAIIGLLLEDDQFIHFKGTRNAKEAWEALRKYHQKASLSNQVYLLKRIINLKLKEDGDMEKYIHEMLSLVDRLSAIGETLKEKLIISIMLSNLPDSFGTLITALETRNENELTLELVKGKLVDEAARRQNVKNGNQEDDKALKVVQRSTYEPERKVEQSSTYTCYFCKKQGHLKKNCIKYQRWKDKNPNKPKQKASQVVGEGINVKSTSDICFHVENNNTSWHENDWCIDSGATSHMSNNRNFFHTLKKSNNESVRLANGSCAEVKGRGDGKICCEDPQGNPLVIPIKDVLYVPALKENLIFVKRLTERDFEVNFTKGMCAIKNKDNIIVKADLCEDLFKLSNTNKALIVTNQHSSNCQHSWHRKLGHRDFQAIQEMVSKGIIKGITVKDFGLREICDTCMKGKMTRKPFPQKSDIKNEPTRFLGEGISFKAKLIGILEVSEARGDRMCQAALADLKMAIRAAGEHKQRIAVQVSIDGLRLREEKSGECLHHHPVHKISFIAQDMSDSRAFGYIFGSPDTGHRFFGIKTDKAASQVVIAIRDLFQVVFELKKKEIELTKQHLEHSAINVIRFHPNVFVEPLPDTKGAAGTESSHQQTKATNSEIDKPAEKRNESQSSVIADLLDLQFELNSLQQGIHHMDKITPENPLPSADDLFETDPFGDSFANMKLEETVQPILPPPPSSSKRGHLERQQTVPSSQGSISSSPATTLTSKTSPLQSTMQWFDKETENLFSDNDLSSSPKNTPIKRELDEIQAKSPQIDVFTELDPLGTGLIKPYVDKKDFFQHLKNPPKKVLKDLVITSSIETIPTKFNVVRDPLDSIKVRNDTVSDDNHFEDSNFANFDRFEENEAVQVIFTRTDSSRKQEIASIPSHHQPLSVSLPPEEAATSKCSTVPSIPTSVGVASLNRTDKDTVEPMHSLVKLPSPIKLTRKKESEIDLPNNKGQAIEKPFPVDFSMSNESPASPLKSCSPDANSRPSSSSAELDLVPEPPPRGVTNILINPPPLPPKKQGVRGTVKPPPRPPLTDTYFHYDFPDREHAPVTAKDRSKSPPKDTTGHFDDNFSPPVPMSNKSDLISSMTTSTFEDSFSSMVPMTNISTFFTSTNTRITTKMAKPTLDITLSQLTSANLDEFANSLGMTVQELTNLTLQQLTECLATLSAKEYAASDSQEVVPPKQDQVTVKKQSVQQKAYVERAYAMPFTQQESKQDTTYDKYAVFRELLELEQIEKSEESSTKEVEEDIPTKKEEFDSVSEQESEESKPETIASLVNLTVKLPPSDEDLTKEDLSDNKVEETTESSLSQSVETETKTKEPVAVTEVETDFLSRQTTGEIEEQSERRKSEVEVEEKEEREHEKSIEVNEDSEKGVESNAEETNGSSVLEKTEVKSSISTSSDKYAALREIIGEPEPLAKQTEEEMSNSTRASPTVLSTTQSKGLAEVELLNFFLDTPPSSASPKKETKKEEETKSMEMDIFEEIKMLSSGTHSAKPSKPLVPDDIFCPFTELKQERDDGKDDGNWAKFDAGLFATDRPSEGSHSMSGSSPWSPDGKEFSKDAFKGAYRHSGDSDNEWKDEEESEEGNERIRGYRYWCSRPPRYDIPGFDERSFYDETGAAPSDKRDRNFRDRMMKKPFGMAWVKHSAPSRSRDPSSWHEESQWDEDSRRCPHRKMSYKDKEDIGMLEGAHWKCRPKPQRWNWSHEHGPFYEDERKRKLMLWSEEDRFGSQESMGYDEDDRCSRRKYERRRWEEDARFWGRRSAGPVEADYPSREAYYYYRESRDRQHDYPSAWDEEYGSDRPGDDSPRYNLPSKKRHWPKRPNSANEGRNADMVYAESRGKFGTSRSECSDNDTDPYLRPSQRSRSRESYWGSDQEYDSWVERPYWSEGPDTKSESLHRKRIPRHKPRQPHGKTQCPFENDFAQSVEHVDPSAVESLATVEPRIHSDMNDQKQPPPSPSSSKRYSKELPRKELQREYSKRSSYFEDDLTPTASASSDASDRQRLPSDLKATPDELPSDGKEPHPSADSFVLEDNSRDSFFNGDLTYDDDAFAFKSELEDNVPDQCATTLPLKNNRQGKYNTGNNNNNNNNNKSRSDQYIRKSESVNIFVRENDPFDDDDFFN